MNDIEKHVIEGTAEVARRIATANYDIANGEREGAIQSLRAALFYLGETLGPLLGVDFLGLEMADTNLDQIVHRLRERGYKTEKKGVAP